MTDTIDETKVQQFAREILGFYRGGMITYLIDIGERTGLFAAAAEGPASSAELAQRAGVAERYVREWVAALTTAGVFDHDPADGTFTLPTERAACLTGPHSLAPFSTLNALLGRHVPAVADAFRHGGGIPYDAYRPEFTDVMDAFSRHGFDVGLVDGLVPAVPGLRERLEGGACVADVGCGTGHAMNVLAAAFPASTFVGFDVAGDAIDKARSEAAAAQLANVTFELCDAAELDTAEKFDAVFSFDAIHDQRDPAGAVARIHDALVPGGIYVMIEARAASTIEDNMAHPMAPWLYAVSTLHCVPVSLAEGGPALGTAWGEQAARLLLEQMGFVDITAGPAPHDPLGMMLVAARAER